MDAIIPFSGCLILALSWASTHFLLPRIRHKNMMTGHLDHPGNRKTQVVAVPYGAGCACVMGVLAPVLVGGGLLAVQGIFGWPAFIATHSEGLLQKLPVMVAVLVGAGILAVMGRRDDSAPMSVGLRLAIQVAVAAIFATWGARATLFMDAPALQVALTVFWILFVTNAINFIDNTDGVMPLTALASSVGILCIAVLDGQLFVAAFALALIGSLLVVVRFNWHPATIYMGDEGSMPIGFLLATLVVVLTTRATESAAGSVAPFLIPPLLLAVPIIDATWVISGRLLSGRSPAQAGQDHLAHALTQRGWSPPRIAAFAGLHSLNFAGMAVFVHGTSAIHLIVAATLALPHIVFLWRLKSRRVE